MSFIFQRFDGRISNWDYFAGLVKLFAIFEGGAHLLPFMLANFLRKSDGFESFIGLISVASALMCAVIVWPLLALINRRKNDLTEAMRNKLGVYSILLPVGVIVVMAAQLVRFTGLNFGDWVSTASSFMPFVIVGILIIGILPSHGGTNQFGPDPRMQRDKSPVMQSIMESSGIPYDKPEPVLAQKMPHYVAPVQKPLAGAHINVIAPSLPNSVIRTRKLPSDGRIKPGWFS